MSQTLIQNALIYDGTGGRPFYSDVLIDASSGTILKIAPEQGGENCEIVDATGKILTPGFINTHSHSELQMFTDPAIPAVLGQGITTEVLGQDGSSVVPVDDTHVAELVENMAPLCGRPPRPYWWRSYADYMAEVEKTHPACRFVGLIGHGTLRMNVMGSDNRPATPEELNAMCALLDKCMKEGAKGISFGLIYPPCSYADMEEMIAVCKVVAAHDGLVMVHMRSEMAHLLDAFEEMVCVMKGSGVRMQISHLKSLGRVAWGKVQTILKRMDELQSQGWDITFDQYPWTAGSTGMKVIAPAWAYAGGEDEFHKRLADPEQYARILRETAAELSARGEGKSVQIAAVPNAEFSWMPGLRLDTVAQKLGMSEPEAVLHILEITRSATTCVYHSICEQDVQDVMRSPWHCVCTDGIVGAVPHPRAYSTFARFIGHYVRDLHIMPLQTAIHHITAEPARRLRLWDRGLIREGMAADLVLMDYEKVLDTNSYTNPKVLPDGICKVWVRGELRYQHS